MTLCKFVLTEAKPGRSMIFKEGQRLTFFSTKAIICYKVIILVKKDDLHHGELCQTEYTNYFLSETQLM